MTTYYVAQVGIALSVVDSSSVYKMSLQNQSNAEIEESEKSRIKSDISCGEASMAGEGNVHIQGDIYQHSKFDWFFCIEL